MHLETLLRQHSGSRIKILQIIGECLNISKEQIASRSDQIIISPKQQKLINRAILELKKGTPLPYCTNKKYFYNLEFIVNNSTLIPRYETEILVENAIKIARKMKCGNVLDIGTGTGNIIISVSKNVGNHLNYFAVDISKDALEVAKENTKLHKLTNIKFYQSDIFSNPNLPKKFDLILANLPYLATDYLSSLPHELADSLKAEPRTALDGGGSSGLEIIFRFILLLESRMNNHGTTIIEIGDDQKKQVDDYCQKHNLAVRTIKDLNGFDRFVVIKKKIHQA